MAYQKYVKHRNKVTKVLRKAKKNFEKKWLDAGWNKAGLWLDYGWIMAGL